MSDDCLAAGEVSQNSLTKILYPIVTWANVLGSSLRVCPNDCCVNGRSTPQITQTLTTHLPNAFRYRNIQVNESGCAQTSCFGCYESRYRYAFFRQLHCDRKIAREPSEGGTSTTSSSEVETLG